MLELKKIHKYYRGKDISVHALKGISLTFRDCEFVSILGQSGCGKTTLLNVIGGLDRYDEGDLIINGKSTKKYTNHDWDVYRNHSIGFVFQSYNLIPHLTILQNVELSLTLSGVSKKERKERAIEALNKVGLSEHIDKKPNQLSGGQMQRVAIARAIVNKPSIILADEPTGALDTQTSIQVMEILKEISKTCLVIMVTHNPELAQQYSTRIIKLLDGETQDDSMPVNEKEIKEKYEDFQKNSNSSKEKVKMSFFTSLGLSFRNLMTKKGRTILTSFAGSIGIIGIALILSVSSGFRKYIADVEEETLSTYPLSITSTALDTESLLEAFVDTEEKNYDDNMIHSNNVLTKMLDTALDSVKQNDLSDFKKYYEENHEKIDEYTTTVSFDYGININVYNYDIDTGNLTTQLLNPFSFTSSLDEEQQQQFAAFQSPIDNVKPWVELMDNQEFLESEYDIIEGHWPEAYNEVVLVVDRNCELYDYYFYCLGLEKPETLLEHIAAKKLYQMGFGEDPGELQITQRKIDELIGRKYRILPEVEYFKADGEGYTKADEDKEFLMQQLNAKGFDIKISGIIMPVEGAKTNPITGCIGYSPKLSEYLINYCNNHELVKKQQASQDINILTNKPFTEHLPTEAQLTPDDICNKLGGRDTSSPSTIRIYPNSFEGKDKIIEFINEYNDTKENDNEKLKYNDLIGVLMSSITTIINAITYVLIAFVSISLVVSSIMIAIVTHISVIERTKEIGVLRSIGASKQDVRNVFNCETLFIGFISGCLGIGVTLLLCIPINIILSSLADLPNIASLPWQGAIGLIIISTVLTIIAGLIPANKAAKLDPVNALRSE